MGEVNEAGEVVKSVPPQVAPTPTAEVNEAGEVVEVPTTIRRQD